MTRTYSNADPEKVRAFAVDVARLLADSKCTDVVLLDVRGHSQVCDYVIIGTGTSQRQMRSVAQESEELGEARGTPAYRSTRDAGTTWVLVDFVETVVHLFEPDQRLYYDIELLWGAATRVEWKRGAEMSPPHAPARKSPALPALAAPVVREKRGAATKAAAKSLEKLPAKRSPASAPSAAKKPMPPKPLPAKKASTSKAPAAKSPTSKAAPKKIVRVAIKTRIAKTGESDA